MTAGKIPHIWPRLAVAYVLTSAAHIRGNANVIRSAQTAKTGGVRKARAMMSTRPLT